jgi:hypothetical protein
MKTYVGEWRYSSTHSLTSALDRGEWSASRPGRFTPRKRAPGTQWIGGWVGPRAVLDVVVKRKIPSPRWEWNPLTPIVQPVVVQSSLVNVSWVTVKSGSYIVDLHQRSAEGVKPVEVIRRCRLNTVIVVYRAVKYTSGQITSKRRDQEGRQRRVERMVRENRRITVDDIAEASICLAQ